ncbi:MAG TPA: HIT domain-containing protein [Chloroflexia bacterium]|nr:HIT domain-containing protein [Chloroflexia bacterium]
MSDFYCEEVLSGRQPVRTVVDTESVLAFHHTRPSYPAHIVVIPKRHISSLLDTGEEDASLLVSMLSVIKLVAQEMLTEHEGCRIVTNLGSYQDSKHLHWHVIAGERF